MWADYTDHAVRAVNHTGNIIKTAFGVATSVTWKMYEEFLESHGVPQTQGGIKERLRVWASRYTIRWRSFKKQEAD